MITMEVVLGFECRPIQAWWLAAEGKCVNLVAFAYFTNITNLVSDMWIFAMPIPIIMKLQTNTNKRLTLCFLFSVGLGVCAISAARLRFVFANASTDITCKYRNQVSAAVILMSSKGTPYQWVYYQLGNHVVVYSARTCQWYTVCSAVASACREYVTAQRIQIQSIPSEAREGAHPREAFPKDGSISKIALPVMTSWD